MNKWQKTFYIIWTGQAFSQLSSSILQFGIVWYLTDTTKSGFVLSMAMLMGFLPQGVLGMFIGVYIDRYDRKKIMVLADLAIAVVSLALVFVSKDGNVSTIVILVVLFLRAVGTAFHTPTLQAITPQLVPESELTKCAGYTQSLQSLSLIISPAIAAVLYSSWSLSGIVLLDVAGALIAVGAVSVCKIPKVEQINKSKKVQVRKEAMEGFRILCSNKGMLGLVLVSSLYTVALMPVSALFPLMCMGHFGGTSMHASVVEITFAAGYMIASVILAKWGGTKNKIHTIVGSYLLMAFCLLVSGILPPGGFVIFAVLAALMGVSGPFYWGMYTPLLQQNFDNQYLGRVMSITGSIRLISGPAALLVSGLISERFGEEKWFVIAGILVVVGTIIIFVVPSIWKCDTREKQLQ